MTLHRALASAVCCAFALRAAMPAAAQSELAGVVVAARGTRAAVVSAEIRATQLGLVSLTDSLGKFRIHRIPAGEHLFSIRAAGFVPDTFLVEFGENESVSREFTLRPAVTQLSEVRVSAPRTSLTTGKLEGFEERRRNGIGRFLDRAAIERWEKHRTGDMLSTVPGVNMKRNAGNKAWVAGSRAVSPSKCAFCQERRDSVLDRADIFAGAYVACHSDVYLDGILVFNSAVKRSPLFDVNTIPPSEIEAVEFYASAAQIPAQFNRTSGGCGVLIIWTRR